ncbi:SemiSWEET transporter [uncultured Rhodospira sp.]|uniref:SemiSWEET transporter n=1 Tax=uncultured Rhodospira sp. TaxID=1936189 RepID=UPI00260DD335|nr:SemiSWEET transporter [uncultured Rhodospira sp.]
MILTQAIGFTAALCTTVAFLPQALKAWRTRSVADLSLSTFLVFTIGVACWLVYGILTVDWPIIVANLVTLLLAGSIVVMRLAFAPRAEPDS